MKTFYTLPLCAYCSERKHKGIYYSPIILFSLVFVTCLFIGLSSKAQLSEQWVSTALKAGTGDAETYVSHTLDENENLLVLGRSGTGQYVNGVWVSDTRMTLYKVNPAGEVLMAKILNLNNGSAWETPAGMFLDKAGDLVIYGITHISNNSQSFIARFSDAGELIWLIQRAKATVRDVDLASDGSIYIVESTVDAAKDCLLTTKLSASGTEVWSVKFFGSNGNGALAYTLKADNLGHVYVASKYDNRTEPYYPSDEEVTLVKFDAANGEQLFVKDLSSAEKLFTQEYESPVEILASPSGNVYLVSQQSNELYSKQVRVYKVSPTGDVMWQQGVGQYINISVHSTVAGYYAAAISKDESIVFTGVDEKYRNFADHFVTKFSSTGERMWYHNLNEEGTNLRFNPLLNMAVSDNGDIVVTGYTHLMQVFNSFPPIVNDLEQPALKTVLYDEHGQIVYEDVKQSNANVFTMGAAAAFLGERDFYVINRLEDKNISGTASQLFTRRYNAGCVATLGATVSEDKYTCNGEGVLLEASGGVDYSWLPEDGLSNTHIADPIANPEQTTTYTVTVTNACGIATTADVTVYVNSQPVDVKLYLPPMAKRVGWQVRTTADFGSHTLDKDTGVRWAWGDGSEPTISYTAFGMPRITGEHTYTKADIYTIGLNFDESCLKPNSEDYTQQMVIYDPEAGYVTGSGEMNAPAVLGNKKLKYSFSVRYPNQYSQEPVGNIHVQLGDMGAMVSKSLDWLVISENRAAVQGTATITGKGTYKFVATMIDAGGSGPNDAGDGLRLQVWDMNAYGKLVFDSNPLASSKLDLHQSLPALGKGQIIINGRQAEIVASNSGELQSMESHNATAYPNPFADKAIVKFTNTADGAYEVQLYDAKGAFVSTLKKGNASTKESVEVEVNGKGLRNGLYFVRLSSASSVQSVKLLLQR